MCTEVYLSYIITGKQGILLKARHIANLRVLVKQVIRRLKTLRILTMEYRINMLKLLMMFIYLWSFEQFEETYILKIN